MSELEQAEAAHNDLCAEFESAGGHSWMSAGNRKEWYCRLIVAWGKVLVLRGEATQNADGTVTTHNTGGFSFSASGESIQ